MTEVSFHFNVADRTSYVCRLVRKATRQGRSVVLTGSAPVLGGIDLALWSFDPLEFIPHMSLRPGETVLQRHRATPVWLTESPSIAPHQEVLVNLGDAAPAGFETYLRLIEIVSGDEADRAAARQRWKHYASRGYSIQRHEVTE